MEYYQSFNKEDAYDGTYLLLIPLGMALLSVLAGEMLVGVKMSPFQLQSGMTYGIVIFNTFMYMSFQSFKYNIKIMDVISEWFLLAFYVLDRLFLIRNIYWTSYIGNEDTHSLITNMRHKQVFEVIFGILELSVILTFKPSRGSLLFLYALFYFMGIKHYNININTSFKQLKDIETIDLSRDENYTKRLSFMIVLCIPVFNAFFEFIVIFGFRSRISPQFVKLTCITLIALRCIFRSLSSATLLFMVDDMELSPKDEEIINLDA